MNRILFPNELSVDFRETARRIGTTIRIPVGGTVFCRGDPSEHMYLLLEGAVDVKHGEKIIESLGPCDALGFVGVLDKKPRTVTALVTKDAELAILDRKNFRYMVETVPHFVWYIMAELVDRLRATNAALNG